MVIVARTVDHKCTVYQFSMLYIQVLSSFLPFPFQEIQELFFLFCWQANSKLVRVLVSWSNNQDFLLQHEHVVKAILDDCRMPAILWDPFFSLTKKRNTVKYSVLRPINNNKVLLVSCINEWSHSFIDICYVIHFSILTSR